MTLESLTDRRIRDLIDQRDKAEAVAHILQGQLTERTRERDAARDLALVLEEVNETALRLHPRSVLSAGVLPEMFGEGRCAYCRLGEPIREYRDYLNGGSRKVPMHDHTDPHPFCVTCVGDDSRSQWPCATVRALTGTDSPEVA